MKRVKTPMFWGPLLIVAGLLLLAQTLGISGDAWAIPWGIVLGAAGVAFLWRFWTDPATAWRSAVPGCGLLGLGAVAVAAGFNLDAEHSEPLGALLLASLAVGFAAVAWVRRDARWPLITSGTFFTLAAITLIATWYNGQALGVVFCFGLALTFTAVYFAPTPPPHPIWSIVTAAVLAAVGALVWIDTTVIANYVAAAGLILAGLYMVYRQYTGAPARHR